MSVAADPRLERLRWAHTWSTADVPQREQFVFWREVVCDAFMPLAPERHEAGAFRGTVRACSLGPLQVAHIAADAQRVRRTQALVARGDRGAVSINLQLRGEGSGAQDGRRAAQRPGDIVVLDHARPLELDFEEPFAQLSVTMPLELLRPRLAGLDALTAVRIDGSYGLGALASQTLASLPQLAATSDRAGARRLADHVAEILALALGLQRTPTSHPSTARALLLQAVLDDIERALDTPDLTPSQTAERVGISLRHLHRICSDSGASYASRVRLRRLERCHGDLVDPALRHLTIAEIALRWGFTDPAHFARAFRREYQLTPRAHRAQRR